jgi:hypothetical protein
MKFSWVEFVLNFDGKIVQMWCKIYTWIEGIDKLLVPKLDFLWKHDGCHKPVAMPRVKMGDHYFLKMNFRVANDKLHFSKGFKTML